MQVLPGLLVEQELWAQQFKGDAISAGVRRVGSVVLAPADFGYLFLIESATGAKSLTLPPLGPSSVGRIIQVKKTDNSPNPVTLTPAAGSAIDGGGSWSFNSPQQTVTVQSDGLNWWVLGPFNPHNDVLLGWGNCYMDWLFDTQISIRASRYIIRRIVFTGATLNLTTVQGGIYTAANKAGTPLVAAGQVYVALTAAAKYLDATLTAVVGTDRRTESSLYFSPSIVQGAAATADCYIFGDRLA